MDNKGSLLLIHLRRPEEVFYNLSCNCRSDKSHTLGQNEILTVANGCGVDAVP